MVDEGAKSVTGTAEKLVDEAHLLIVSRGYNGFSYADLSERLGIRKASIHHHFPSKVDLVTAVVERSRRGIRGQIAAVEEGSPGALEQLLAYTGYWRRCILEQTAPFCLAGVLAAEMPALPEPVTLAVQGHFRDLRDWAERVLALGVSQGSIRLRGSAGDEADVFLATVYGAMLAARAFQDPAKFGVAVDAFLLRIRP